MFGRAPRRPLVLAQLTDLISSANSYLHRAVSAREQYYQGMREAELDWRRPGNGAMSPDDAKYKFGQSQLGKQLVADNQWHMAQARSYASVAQASALAQLVHEHQETNRLLKEILKVLTKEANGG